MNVIYNLLPPLVMVFFKSPRSLRIKLNSSDSLSTNLKDFFVVLDSTLLHSFQGFLREVWELNLIKQFS